MCFSELSIWDVTCDLYEMMLTQNDELLGVSQNDEFSGCDTKCDTKQVFSIVGGYYLFINNPNLKIFNEN